MVMVSNCTGYEFGVLAERYRGGLLGHLYQPTEHRGPYDMLPMEYSVDNWAYKAYADNLVWRYSCEPAWRKHIEWAASNPQRPLWAVVPDVVGQRVKTLEQWEEFAPVVLAAGIRPAFAVQDDMTFDDVPDADCMLFLGGTTPWKEAAIRPWCKRFPGRVHVGRVTEAKRLMKCYEAGAVSVDGNDWFRKKNKKGSRPQREVLIEYLEFASKRLRRAA